MLEEYKIGQIMKKVQELKIVIPAFNIAYLPMCRPVVETLIENETFGLIEVARPDVEKFGAKSYQAVKEEFALLADRNFMRLHLDHTPVIDEEGNWVDWEKIIAQALELGYDSLMIDGSRLSLEENIKVTKRACEMAHTKGIPVEAELGAVLGHEKGPLPPYEELFSSGKGFTRIEEASRFVQETKVDWLSVAVGNIHGAISDTAKDQAKVKARINVEHLCKLREVTAVPLVLHGGSGIQREYVLEAIKNGISKINIGTDIRQVYEKALKERPNDIPVGQQAVAEKMRELIQDYYQIKGSAQKIAEAICKNESCEDFA